MVRRIVMLVALAMLLMGLMANCSAAAAQCDGKIKECKFPRNRQFKKAVVRFKRSRGEKRGTFFSGVSP